MPTLSLTFSPEITNLLVNFSSFQASPFIIQIMDKLCNVKYRLSRVAIAQCVSGVFCTHVFRHAFFC